jgi:methylenetetrahydrofolate reductase (NADPH)
MVSLAGHPEGHPKVAADQMRRAEREKAASAARAGLQVTLITQFIFEHAPVVEWIHDLRAHGVSARAVAGLAGPAKLTTLLKFALRCGVGASIRALSGRSSSRFVKLMGEHGPEQVMRGLAQARAGGDCDLHGLLFFVFGGFFRTCAWLDRVSKGEFTLIDRGFAV